MATRAIFTRRDRAEKKFINIWLSCERETGSQMGCRWRGSLREFTGTGTRGGVDVQVRVTVTCANNQVSRENSPMESRGVKIEAFRLIFPIGQRPDSVLISYLLNKRRFIVLNSISSVEPLWLCQSCERSARGALFYSQI